MIIDTQALGTGRRLEALGNGRRLELEEGVNVAEPVTMEQKSKHRHRYANVG